MVVCLFMGCVKPRDSLYGRTDNQYFIYALYMAAIDDIGQTELGRRTGNAAALKQTRGDTLVVTADRICNPTVLK